MSRLIENLYQLLTRIKDKLQGILLRSLGDIKLVFSKALKVVKYVFAFIFELLLSISKFIFSNYIFSAYRYVLESVFTLAILFITWFLINNSKMESKR